MSGSAADPGSFRDPLNRVFVADGAVYRGYKGAGVDDLEALEASSFFAAAIERGDLVATERVDASVLDGEWDVVVEHERIPHISYPYEWTFSMLQDAALLQLRLTREALADGLITKDATPYNVQFIGGRPVFIDVGSFERLRKGEPWPGYRQFCQMFLNPLLLQARKGVPFQPWLRGKMEGISPTEIADMLSRRDRVRGGMLAHVALQARAERKYAAAAPDSERDVVGEMKRAGFGPAVIDAQLKNLIKAVQKLEWKQAKSTWSTYSDRGHYTDVDLELKEAFVSSVVGESQRSLVWDLGANDGHFSRLAAQNSDNVVAVDFDALVIDRLYGEMKQGEPSNISVMTMDLIDSSPSMGWRSMERTAFYSRSAPDVVLALALVHHLAIPGTVPIPQIVEWLDDLGAEIVLEVPHEDDPMVRRLLAAKREGLFDHYTLKNFEVELDATFDIRRTEALPSGTRTLFHLAPRS